MEIIIKPITNPVAFELFAFQIRWYGIIMALSIFIGVFLSYHFIYFKISKEIADKFVDFAPFLIFISIIGARLFYVIAKYEYYLNNPEEIFMINHGGLSIWGALFFGLLFSYLFIKQYKSQIIKILDIFALSMPLCQAIGRFGNYFNQEAYGKPTSFFLKLYIEPQFRLEKYFNYEYFHPTFLYESVLNFTLFLFLFFIYFKCTKKKDGTIVLLYFLFYSIIRFIVETCRIDSVLYIQNIPIAQLICVLVFIVSTVLLLKMYIKKGV